MKFEKYLLANIEKQQNTLKISLLLTLNWVDFSGVCFEVVLVGSKIHSLY